MIGRVAVAIRWHPPIMGNLGLDWLRGLEASPEGTRQSLAYSTAIEDESLSLVLGGPLYQLYLRTKLLRSPIGLLRRRTLTLAAICWLPLCLILCFPGTARGLFPLFLSDVTAQVNLLAVLPMLIGSEVFVHRQIPDLIRQFLFRGIIAPDDRPRFERLVASTVRLRNSVTIEICLFVAALILGQWIWMNGPAREMSRWLGALKQGRVRLSAAGYWYAFVSLPILRFLLLRWYYRLFLWYRFLWKLRGFPLRLSLFHPDRAGGLGFLSESMFAFSPILMAQTLAIAGTIGNRIFHAGASLSTYATEAVGVFLFLMFLAIAPLGFFSGRLFNARQSARDDLGVLSSRYVDAFRRKWIESEPGEPLLGSPDIQSLADLGNAFDTAAEMRIVPFGAKALMRLAFIIAAPLALLTLTIVPLDRAVKGLVKLLL